MWRATLASIRAHKLRLLSTSVAIVIGVGFVSGTLILSDTLQNTFDDLFGQTLDGIDVAVRGAEDSADPFTFQREGVPQEVVDVITAVDGVRGVSPEVEGVAQLIDADGQPIGGFGPPTIGISAPVDPAMETPSIREGVFPAADGELAVDVATATAVPLAVGDTVDVVIDGPVETFTVTGLVGFGELDNLAGATLVVLAFDTAVERWGQDGFQTVHVFAEDGVDPVDLRDDVAAAVGGSYDVQTGAELGESLATDVGEALGFLTAALLVFAGVSLFVGAFLIANTFSIIVAQRTRELALLRAVGASRRQVLLTVMGEALATGLIGSLLGFAAGAGLARGLFALMNAFDIALPQGSLVVTGGTLLVAVLLGTVLTLVVALLPALRGTNVPPVTALQAVAAPPPPRYGRLRYIAGGVVFVAGVAGLAFALAGNGGGLTGVGVGAAVTLIGAALLAPLLTRPLLRVIGAPVAAGRGVQGQLANENALRNPRRTAATASALMIGLALVTFIQILATSFTTATDASIDQAFTGDFTITPAGFTPPQGQVGPRLAEELRAVDGVAVAGTQHFGLVDLDEEEQFVLAVGGDTLLQGVFTLTYIEGDAQGFIDGGLAISDEVARDRDMAVGDVLTVTTARGATGQVEVGAIIEANPFTGGWLLEDAVVPGGAAEVLQFGGIDIGLAGGADPEVVGADIEEVLTAYPTLRLMDLTEIKAEIRSQINQLLGIVQALLALSVIVALFGIVNTLGLSVFERTRELGLLRAVGAARAQVRSMIRWEAVLIAVLGAVFGLVLGTLFAWLVVTALSDQGVLTLTVPAWSLVAGMVAAALAGVVAAILPARRAARIDILRALEAQ